MIPIGNGAGSSEGEDHTGAELVAAANTVVGNAERGKRIRKIKNGIQIKIR